MRLGARSRILAMVVAAVVVTGPAPASAASWPAGTHSIALSVSRIAGADRYATAVEIARAGWPGWSGISRVIVASGEQASLADPLCAGSLCWAYDAPLLLVKGGSVPPSVAEALSQIATANGGVDITIVGGTAVVGPDVVAEIAALVAPGRVEQPWTVGNRYDTSAGVALRAARVARETSRAVPARALIANGNDAFGLVDALALSAVSARTGVPLLLVERDRTLPAVASVLETLPAGDVIAAGGTAVVSDAVYAAVGGSQRWSGQDRYATSVAVAEGAHTRGWLTGSAVGVAATVPDALAGSVHAARLNAPLFITRGAQLAQPVAYHLAALGSAVRSATIYGGTGVVSGNVARELSGSPSAPVVLGPRAGALVGGKAPVKVGAGINTSEVRLYSGSTLVGTRAVQSYGIADFGLVGMPANGVSLTAVAVSPMGPLTQSSVQFKRLTYPAATSIVIDKSDFRLYYVKNDVLIETYPIAIGRPSMETPVRLWKILAKYYTDPSSVYGPRKMRLYKQSGSSWVYTSYAIHGTNEPWVIGTKASHGCIRLYNADILDLFPQVAIGTLVQSRE